MFFENTVVLTIFFFLCITQIFDHTVKQHHEQLRMNGFHDFYRSSSGIHRIPFYIVSLWNTVILTMAALIHHYYGEHFFEKCIQSYMSPIVYITLFNSLETIVLAFVNGSYICKHIDLMIWKKFFFLMMWKFSILDRVRLFNRSKEQPDALRGNHLVSGSVGLTQRGADAAELLEKQADLISYLKDHNLKLNQKLMAMAQQRHSNHS